MNIYVGNLSHQTAEGELRQAFESYGEVAKVNIVKDKFTGDPRGFGFVEMPVKEEATAAIGAMNGHNLGGRSLTVNEARPRTDNNRSGSGGGGGYKRSW